MIRRTFGVLPAAAFVVTACSGAAPPANEKPAPTPPPVSAAATAPLPDGLDESERRDIATFRKASSSVVNITNIGLRRDFFSFDVSEVPQGSGSGFVWDREGHVVTNFHVIENGNRFTVSLSEDVEYEATVVGAAPDKDVAVLKIEAGPDVLRKLEPLPLGRSVSLAVGQRVLAVGNPFGFDHTLTTGVVSGLGREIRSPSGRRIRDVIQTDAAINPGNSGGPLLDSSGRLIGVNSQIVSPSGASAGIGFAVPIDAIARIVPQLIRYGRLQEPGIAGVSFVSDAYAQRWGVEGVIVREVARGSPAEEAGLSGITKNRSGSRIRLGDVIVAVEGKRVRSSEELYDAFESAGLGATVRLTVESGRDGERREVRVRLRDVGGET
ncbi:MAG TPA: trypsin-like peptidase domain-containing protein [Candidatus Polarisedimenticolaceae bacterium]|nr:trypsin-like peptidase domain-containing protein [Candidatus Polarisedimenticolaceae bacterium]